MPRGQRRVKDHEESEETRATILRIAEQLFMEYGYRAVSTRQIADACGLTQPALYHHFADKQSLYIAVIQETTARTQAALERIVRRNEGIAERLRLTARYLLNATQHDISMMLHDIMHELEEQSRSLLYDLFQTALIAPISTIFADGIRQDLLRTPQSGGVEPVVAAHLFMSMLSRFVVASRPAGNGSGEREPVKALQSQQERIDVVVQTLLYGLIKEHQPISS